MYVQACHDNNNNNNDNNDDEDDWKFVFLIKITVTIVKITMTQTERHVFNPLTIKTQQWKCQRKYLKKKKGKIPFTPITSLEIYPLKIGKELFFYLFHDKNSKNNKENNWKDKKNNLPIIPSLKTALPLFGNQWNGAKFWPIY